MIEVGKLCDCVRQFGRDSNGFLMIHNVIFQFDLGI